MGVGYISRRGLEIYRERGVVQLLIAGLRFISYSLVDEPTRFTLRSNVRYRLQRLRYDAPANPFHTISVNPNDVRIANYEVTQYKGLGLIRNGDWDGSSNNIPLEDYWSVKGIRERFVDGRRWEETTYYKHAAENFQESETFWRYDDIEEFKRVRCGYVDELFEEISENGYRSNSPDDHDVPERTYKQMPHQKLEVLVTIGRDGEILFRDGHHRMAIAQILDVDRIPVNVLARHRNWQRIRDEVSAADSASELTEAAKATIPHPDLTDVLSEELERDLETET